MQRSVRAAFGAAAVLAVSVAGCGSDPRPASTGPWAAVSAGGGHTVAIRSDGTLWAFGVSTSGPYVGGTSGVQPAPVQVGTASRWAAVSAGAAHTVALTRDGELFAWGQNTGGRLGDGTQVERAEPTALPTTARFVAASAGTEHTAAIRSDGTLWAWGSNASGQVGDPGAALGHLAPFLVGTCTAWSAVSAGPASTVALRRDGTLWTWGWTTHGVAPAPVQVGAAASWTAVSVGGGHAVALQADGTLWVWGNGQSGELGLGTGVLGQPDPAPLPTTARWLAVSAGGHHTLAIRSDATVWAWGNGAEGELGAGRVVSRAFTPVLVAGLPAASAVAAGFDHSIALGGGALFSWGSGRYGQLGLGGAGIAEERTAPTAVGAFAAVAARAHGAAALGADGSLWSWGWDASGAVGNGPVLSEDVAAPVRLGTATDWTALVAGGFHTLATRAGGRWWGFGDDQVGQLGPGPEIWYEPAPLATTATFTQVAAGKFHTTLLRADGTIWSFGSDYNGQLGVGSSPWAGGTSSDPVMVPTTAVWIAVAAGGYHTLALRDDRTLWAWGDNSEGQLGDGSSAYLRTSPVQVGTASDWAALSGGLQHSLALKTDGSLWAWGNNWQGQLGDGSGATIQRSPVRVGASNDWTEVSAGGAHSLGRRGGALYAWGDGTFGEVGDGTRALRDVPVRIGLETTWTRVAAGERSSYALRDGTLYAWGDDFYGQLGLGRVGRVHDRWTPARVP